jgi:hypothetical protein
MGIASTLALQPRTCPEVVAIRVTPNAKNAMAPSTLSVQYALQAISLQ